MKTRAVGNLSYWLGFVRGVERPRFIVLGKQPNARTLRPTICSGYVEHRPKLRVVVDQGVLPMWVESRIFQDARDGLFDGPEAAKRRWRYLVRDQRLEKR
jgi:hypothetical protein